MTLAEANHVLRLSDSQLAIVRQAAVPLSPSARDRYLKTVAAELVGSNVDVIVAAGPEVAKRKQTRMVAAVGADR